MLLQSRHGRHRAAALFLRGCAIAVLAAAVNEFPPTRSGDFIRIAIAYLACLILAMLLVLVAAIHDLVAATLKKGAQSAWVSLTDFGAQRQLNAMFIAFGQPNEVRVLPRDPAAVFMHEMKARDLRLQKFESDE